MTEIIKSSLGISSKVNTSIWVTFQKIGYHKYPNAPKDVDYLESRHRHLFKFRVSITVHHDEREIEYHQFLNKILSWYETDLEVNNSSCETIARLLVEKIRLDYDCSRRVVSVEVSEDGECGSVVTSSPWSGI